MHLWAVIGCNPSHTCTQGRCAAVSLAELATNRKMSLSKPKHRKVDYENRQFQSEWAEKLLSLIVNLMFAVLLHSSCFGSALEDTCHLTMTLSTILLYSFFFLHLWIRTCQKTQDLIFVCLFVRYNFCTSV